MAQSSNSASGNGPAEDNRNQQTERVLRWVWGAMLAGLFVIAVAAVTIPDISGWRFFAVGALAGLAAAAAGGALGLLFGLPISNQVVVVAQPNAAREEGAREAAAPRPEWFRDNTSMEQIADWLTKIIVGLTLTQWASFQSGFDRIAAAVTAAMMPPAPAAQSPAAVLDMSKVPGGLIFAAYVILGFLLVYIWARIYLSSEFASARVAQHERQRESDPEFIKRARDQDGVPVKRDNADVPALAEQAVAEAEKSQTARTESLAATPRRPGAIIKDFLGRGDKGADAFAFPAVVKPGNVTNDPWKGRFGGKSSDGEVGIAASVRRLEDSSYFAVRISIGGLTDEARAELRGKAARLYLHPTFPRPIRMERFDEWGTVQLPLVAYGAFTLGVQLWDGRSFELDLGLLHDAPLDFRAS
jgi:FtsH-binding integral membrane protein